MRTSKGLSLMVLALSVLSSGSAVLAGPQSALDPYAGVQAPRQGRTKFVQADKSSRKVTGAYDDLTSRAHDLTQSSKQAGVGIVSGTAEAGAKIAHTGKRLSQGVASKTLSVGGGLAGGARASGAFFMKGARVVGHGFKATGVKLADGSQTVIEKVSTWPGNIGHGLAVTGGKIADGGKVVSHSVVAGTDKLKDGGEALGEKLAATPKVVGQGLKAGSEKIIETPKMLGHKRTGEKEEVATASKPAATPNAEIKTPAGGDSGLLKSTAALPKAVGHGVKLTAVKVTSGSQQVGKKVAGLPGTMGRQLGRLFGRHDNQPPATAEIPTGQVH